MPWRSRSPSRGPVGSEIQATGSSRRSAVTPIRPTVPDAPAATVDAFVTALSAQASRDASEPIDVTVGGYAGKSITLHVPEDAAFAGGEFTDCDQGFFVSFGGPGSDPDGLDRLHQGPGQIDELWILDVDGALVIIDANYYDETPAADVEGLRAIAESATFETP